MCIAQEAVHGMALCFLQALHAAGARLKQLSRSEGQPVAVITNGRVVTFPESMPMTSADLSVMAHVALDMQPGALVKRALRNNSGVHTESLVFLQCIVNVVLKPSSLASALEMSCA